MDYQTLDIYYDIDNRIIVDSVTHLKSKRKVLPAIYYGERVLIRLHLLEPGESSYTYYTGLSDTDVFTCYLNDTLLDTSTTFTPMAEAVNADINVAEDWDASSPSSGKLSIRLNADTTSFRDAIDNQADGIQAFLELSVIPAEKSYNSHTFTMVIKALPPVSQKSWTFLTQNADFDDQPVSSTEITMLTDQTDYIQSGSALRLKIGSSYYYTTCDTITSFSLIVTDEFLTTGDGDLKSVGYEILPASPPSLVYTKAQVDALLSVLFLESNLDVLNYNILSSTGSVSIVPASGYSVKLSEQTTFAEYLNLKHTELITDIDASGVLDINIPAEVKLHSVLMNVEEDITDSTSSGTFSASFSGGNSNSIVTGASYVKDNKINTFMDENAASSITSDITDITLTPDGGSFTGGRIKVRVYYWEMEDLPDASEESSSSSG